MHRLEQSANVQEANGCPSVLSTR